MWEKLIKKNERDRETDMWKKGDCSETEGAKKL